MKSKALKRPSPLLWGVPLICTLVAYWGVQDAAFLSWDDNVYVYENILIKRLNPTGIKDIFRNFVMGNYHPLVLLTYAIEYAGFGLKPAVYHLNNLFLHILTTLLVMRLAYKLSGNIFIGMCTALFFGVHPLHTESVAWVTERKDVLYGLFYFAALNTWDTWRRTGKKIFYLWSILLFLLSCLSKGQGVTLPLAFVLTDFMRGQSISALIKDKYLWMSTLPSLGFGILAVYAQQYGGNIRSSEAFSALEQFLVGVWSLLFYIPKYIFPWPLVPFYPYPPLPLGMHWYLAPFALGLLIYFIIRFRNTYAFLCAGLLFYLVHLLPVAQFLPVGNAIAADRYFYVPAFGLAWMSAILIFRYLSQRNALGLMAAISLVWMFMTWQQVKIWKNTETFFRHIIEKDPSVDFAFVNLGRYLEKNNRKREAVDVYLAGMKANPNYPDQYNDAGYTMSHLGLYDSAVVLLNKALELSPGLSEAHNNLGYTYSMMQHFEVAEKHLLKAIELNPLSETAYNNLGSTYSMMERMEEARKQYFKAVEIKPEYADAWNNLGSNYGMSGDNIKALEYFEKAIRIRPDFGGALFNAGIALQTMGNEAQAFTYYQRSARTGHAPAQMFLQEKGIQW